ncbi:hypothetical protein [Poriferisphaera sp. WC338]
MTAKFRYGDRVEIELVVGTKKHTRLHVGFRLAWVQWVGMRMKNHDGKED